MHAIKEWNCLKLKCVALRCLTARRLSQIAGGCCLEHASCITNAHPCPPTFSNLIALTTHFCTRARTHRSFISTSYVPDGWSEYVAYHVVVAPRGLARAADVTAGGAGGGVGMGGGGDFVIYKRFNDFKQLMVRITGA